MTNDITQAATESLLKEKPTWPATLAECFELEVLAEQKWQVEGAANQKEQMKSGVSDERWPNMLTRAEELVFGFDRDAWPRCAAALDAYFHFTGEGARTRIPDAVYETARQNQAYILKAGDCVEAFATFAHVFCSVKVRDAYAAYWKEEMWHVRQNLRYLTLLPGEEARAVIESSGKPA